MHVTSESNLYYDAQFIEEYRIAGCRRRTSFLYTMYFFAISATQSMIHRTYSKGDKQPVDAHGDQRNLSTGMYLSISNDPGKGIDNMPILFLACSCSESLGIRILSLVRFDLPPLDLSKGCHFFFR
jgi:hypothetical protein